MKTTPKHAFENGTDRHSALPDAVGLAIVGGGAAGMFAAAVAAQSGVPSLVIERKARLGAKMLMTANGRCNFTKDLSPDAFLADVGPCAEFVARAVAMCPPRQIMADFQSLGVRLRRMPDGRIFPADGKATTVVHALGDFLRDSGTPLLTNCPVAAIQPQKNGFLVATQGFSLRARNVLLATGGLSYPKLGSVGDGQAFARSLGHRLVPCRPGLAGLETDDPRVLRLAGSRFENGRARVVSPDGEALFDVRGEVDCEPFGLAGAAIYNAQRFVEHARPADWSLDVWLDGLGPLRFHALRPRPLKEAIVTLGGVSLDEVKPDTMESRLVPGLYFAGEVLDIDGPTGGYNLTLAFATAALAVQSVRKTMGKQG